jgi:hypothetical protein
MQASGYRVQYILEAATIITIVLCDMMPEPCGHHPAAIAAAAN